MRLDALLLARELFDSRARAQAAIKQGQVIVNGTVAAKPSQNVSEDAEISLSDSVLKWASRAGLKLEHGLALFGVSPKGREALDVGSSTGGFVDVLLAWGAARVTAVDVGTDQLIDRLREDDRVEVREQTDARDLTEDHLPARPDFVTTDVSFISMTKALGPALAFAADGADFIGLIKPQFEVGRKGLAKGGIVKDDALRSAARDDVVTWLNGLDGWQVVAVTDSPITGGDGNVEYLVHAQKEMKQETK